MQKVARTCASLYDVQRIRGLQLPVSGKSDPVDEEKGCLP